MSSTSQQKTGASRQISKIVFFLPRMVVIHRSRKKNLIYVDVGPEQNENVGKIPRIKRLCYYQCEMKVKPPKGRKQQQQHNKIERNPCKSIQKIPIVMFYYHRIYKKISSRFSNKATVKKNSVACDLLSHTLVPADSPLPNICVRIVRKNCRFRFFLLRFVYVQCMARAHIQIEQSSNEIDRKPGNEFRLYGKPFEGENIEVEISMVARVSTISGNIINHVSSVVPIERAHNQTTNESEMRK